MPTVPFDPLGLAELTPNAGRKLRVGRVTSDALLELGLTPGTEVEMIREGGWHMPMVLRIRNTVVSLRRDGSVLLYA